MFSIRCGIFTVLFCLIVTGAHARQSPYEPRISGFTPDGPTWTVRQGRLFQVSTPETWRSHEVANGMQAVDRDGVTAFRFLMFSGTRVDVTPEQLIRWQLSAEGARQLRITRINTRATRANGRFQRQVEVAVHYKLRGAKMTARIRCAVSQERGRFRAVYRAWQSPASIWSRMQRTIGRVDRSLRLLRMNPWRQNKRNRRYDGPSAKMVSRARAVEEQPARDRGEPQVDDSLIDVQPGR